MVRKTLSEVHKLYRAKAEYNLAKSNNPVLFAEKRNTFAEYFIDSLMKRTPRWGGLKIDMPKNF
jgi:hypothetical protein